MKKIFKITLIIFLILSVILLAVASIFLRIVIKETNQISLDKNKLLLQATQVNIYDASGVLTNSSNVAGRDLITIDKLQPHTIQAFISIEDKNFYKHTGINYKRMFKAMYNNLKNGKIVEGASTITQQLIKNTHLSNEKTLKRKTKEIFLAKKLESKYTKDEIMEIYLNVIYFGDGCYGIEEASQRYFGISASELSIEQSAVLAGMIKSPYTYSPVNNYNNSLKRRNLVLKEMHKDGYITSEELNSALTSEIVLTEKDNECDYNSLYVKAVINEACEVLNVNETELALNNYKIYTYLDNKKQEELYNIMQNDEYYHVNSHGNIADGLALIIDNQNGGIEAFAGKSKYNLVNIKRQPGSAIKPILVYAPALEEGKISNCTPILDDELNIGGYTPQNVGGVYHGYVSVRDSVAQSLNIPAIKTMEYVGIDKCKKFAENSGIDFAENDNGYAIALGGFTNGVTLQQLTNSFLPFSNNGKFIQSGFVQKITTQNGITVYQKDTSGKQVMGSDTAYLTTDLLISGVEDGTSKKLKTLPYQIAGKTGTVAVKGTNLNTDAISVAYTSEHTIGVWFGNYSYDKKYHLEGKNNGGTYATAVIKDTFNQMYKDAPPADFIMPDTVEEVAIDWLELQDNHVIKLAGVGCPEKYRAKEIFSKRYLPQNTSTRFENLFIDFDVKNINESVTISADLEDYLSYKLMRNNALLDTIENTQGEYQFVDENLKPNTMYEYYFVITNPYNEEDNISKKVSIITKDKYQALLENEMKKNNNLSWYFS